MGWPAHFRNINITFNVIDLCHKCSAMRAKSFQFQRLSKGNKVKHKSIDKIRSAIFLRNQERRPILFDNGNQLLTKNEKIYNCKNPAIIQRVISIPHKLFFRNFDNSYGSQNQCTMSFRFTSSPLITYGQN